VTAAEGHVSLDRREAERRAGASRGFGFVLSIGSDDGGTVFRFPLRKLKQDQTRIVVDAVLIADHLGEVADHLIGHFVDQARRSGASWTDIGRSLGVTKQAAQKRFVPKATGDPASPGVVSSFGRYTERARNVVMAAQNAAHAANNDRIGPAHLVLGLLAEPGSLAIRALRAQGIEPDAIRQAAGAALPPPAEQVPDLVPFDAGAKRCWS
jgi:hypothetical protein